MESKRKCIIDNWSLEQAGFVLNNTNDIKAVPDKDFDYILGGLSNYINALLLYEDSFYLQNGFESEWTRFNPLDPSITEIDWESEFSYSDQGITNYLTTSNIFESDLFVSPQRSLKIVNANTPKINDTFISTLKKIDDKISNKKEESWYENIQIGIESNFKLPSLTHYVFSQASSLDDLMTVLMQLKSDGKISRVKKKINELTNSTKSSIKLQREIEDIIDNVFGSKSKQSSPFSLKINILFLSISQSVNLSFFNRKEHIVFLKDVAALRSESRRLNDDVKRVFKRKN